MKKNHCPLCGKPAAEENNPYAPFCSERCKLIDLGQWASGKYAIPGEKVQAEQEPGGEAGEEENKEEKK